MKTSKSMVEKKEEFLIAYNNWNNNNGYNIHLIKVIYLLFQY